MLPRHSFVIILDISKFVKMIFEISSICVSLNLLNNILSFLCPFLHPNNETLYMRKIDIMQEETKALKVEYDVYCKLYGDDLIKLNLSLNFFLFSPINKSSGNIGFIKSFFSNLIEPG